MKRIKIFISSVQSEFAEERAMLCHYIRTDVLLGKFFEPFIFDIVRKTFVDLDGLRTSVYASLIRYLEEKEYIRWRPFDASCDNGATSDDLDENKMKNFIHMARSKRNFPLSVETSPEALLTHLDLIDEDGRLANAAILLFGKKPQKYFITSEVKCVQFYGNVVEKPMPAYQIYRGDVFELVDQATSFVMSRIDNWVGTRAVGEKADIPTRPELPMDAVKEAIVNAVCHRDYTSNASVQIMLFRNRLEVWNPGTLPYGLTVQKLHGPHKSLPANPLLADPMYWNGYIEKVGTGTEDIINKCRDYGLKTPEFYQEEDFRVVIWRANEEQDDPNRSKDDPKMIQSVPNDEARLVELIKETPSISRAELSKQLSLSERQIRKIIDQLRANGKLIREGGKVGKWIIVEE